MADYSAKGERQKSFANQVINYLERANANPEFLDTFLAVINGASDSCGDRMALSVINLGIAYQINSFDLNIIDMKHLASFFKRGVLAMKFLEEIAREKFKSLPLTDEVEVYLGYPMMLKEELELPIEIEEMLFFDFSQLEQEDLDIAKEIVLIRLSNEEFVSEFLVTQDKWMEAVKLRNPEELSNLQRIKDRSLGELKEDAPNYCYEEIELEFKKGLLSITKMLLT
jgi:hypothetical protein